MKKSMTLGMVYLLAIVVTAAGSCTGQECHADGAALLQMKAEKVEVNQQETENLRSEQKVVVAEPIAEIQEKAKPQCTAEKCKAAAVAKGYTVFGMPAVGLPFKSTRAVQHFYPKGCYVTNGVVFYGDHGTTEEKMASIPPGAYSVHPLRLDACSVRASFDDQRCKLEKDRDLLESCATTFCSQKAGSRTTWTFSECSTCFDNWCKRGGHCESTWCNCAGKARKQCKDSTVSSSQEGVEGGNGPNAGNMGQLEHNIHCPSDFSTLELHTGNFGDTCIGKVSKSWTCPEGCNAIYAEDGTFHEPWCLKVGTRDNCDQTKCNTYPFSTLVPSHSPNRGNTCTTGSLKEGNGRQLSPSWISPRGCYTKSLLYPFTWDSKFKTKICRIKAGRGLPHGHWNLAASSTNGVEVQLEVGVSSMTSKAVTKESSMTLGFSTETSAGVEGDVFSASVTMTASMETTNSVAHSVETAIQQDKVVTVTATCPDGTNVKEKMWRNPNSYLMEYIYQWVVTDDEIIVKTQHFRCHQTNGPEEIPECPPTLCGDPSTNPFCKFHVNKCQLQ